MVSSAHKAELELIESVKSFHRNPLGFVMFAYPWGEKGSPLEKYEGPDTWQTELLLELGEEITKRNFDGFNPVAPIRITRSSGHGIGKGVMAAFLTDFVMSTRPNCRGSVTANSYHQLETKTWSAIQKWTKMCITSHWFEVTGHLMYQKQNRAEWFTAALSCAEENSQAFAGQHAADSTSFYIIDEGSTVPDPIYNVADGGMTDGEPMIFVWGNPTVRSGKFYRINFGDERNRWNHKAIDSRTCKFTNKTQIKEWEEDWGEDSDRFRVQVRGLPPSASDSQFIATNLVSAAQKRETFALRTDPVICGVDISRGGKDDCVFRFRRGLDGRSIPPIKITGEFSRDSTVLVDKMLEILKLGAVTTIKEVDNFGRESSKIVRVPVDMMFVDGTGVGGPICDQVKNLGYEKRVIEIQFGNSAPNSQGYQSCANMRSWMWELMRVWLNRGGIDESSDLESDLTSPMFHYNAKNELVLEAKESIKDRMGTSTKGGSPDDGDALALTFAKPVAPKKSRGNTHEEDEEYNADGSITTNWGIRSAWG